MENVESETDAISVGGEKNVVCVNLREAQIMVKKIITAEFEKIEPVGKNRYTTNFTMKYDENNTGGELFFKRVPIDFFECGYMGLKILLVNVRAEVKEKREATKIEIQELEKLLNE